MAPINTQLLLEQKVVVLFFKMEVECMDGVLLARELLLEDKVRDLELTQEMDLMLSIASLVLLTALR